jgi:hypothetical protein
VTKGGGLDQEKGQSDARRLHGRSTVCRSCKESQGRAWTNGSNATKRRYATTAGLQLPGKDRISVISHPNSDFANKGSAAAAKFLKRAKMG